MPRPAPSLNPSDPSPERRALAEAIARHDGLKREIVEADAASRVATNAHNEARSAAYHAQDLLERAMPLGDMPSSASGASRRSHEQAEAFYALPRIPVADARAKLAAAEDDEASTKRATQDAARDAAALRERLTWAEHRVKDAVRNAILNDPAFASLQREAIRLERAARDARSALSLVDLDFGRVQEGELRKAALALPEEDRFPTMAAWMIALQRLAEDADAVLPA